MMFITFKKFRAMNDRILAYEKTINRDAETIAKLRAEISKLNRRLEDAVENEQAAAARCDDLEKQRDAAREAKRQAIQQLSRANGDKVNLERLVCELEKRERLFHE